MAFNLYGQADNDDPRVEVKKEVNAASPVKSKVSGDFVIQVKCKYKDSIDSFEIDES